MNEDDFHIDFDPPTGLERCDACGELYPAGAWPWCTSKQNPAGHATQVNYGWHF